MLVLYVPCMIHSCIQVDLCVFVPLVCVAEVCLCVNECIRGAQSEPNRKLCVPNPGAVCSKYNVRVELESY